MRARVGRYSQLEVNRGLPVRLLVEHFSHVGVDWQLSERIRSMVTFRQINLARHAIGVPPMDVVLLRNLLIYFDEPTRRAVIDRVAHILRPGGYLLLGSSESLDHRQELFERVVVNTTVFHRRLPGGR